MLEVWVIGPIEKANTVLNGSPALLGEGNSELDHVRSLGIAQLGAVSLVSIDTQDVHGHVDR